MCWGGGLNHLVDFPVDTGFVSVVNEMTFGKTLKSIFSTKSNVHLTKTKL